MLVGGEVADLSKKALACRAVRHQTRMGDLDDDFSLESVIPGEIDSPHAAAVERALDLVSAVEALADERAFAPRFVVASGIGHVGDVGQARSSSRTRVSYRG